MNQIFGNKLDADKKRMNHLHIIIDESGSMSSISHAVYEGARELIDGVSDIGTVCLTRFNGNVTPGQDMDKESARLAFVPSQCQGSTALYDAISSAIRQTLDNHGDEPSVTIAVVTDGVENASTRSNIQQVRDLVNEANTKEWRVVFIGANQDAVMTAQTMGINSGRALTYGSNEADTRNAFRSLNAANGRYVRGEGESFTNVERTVSNTGTGYAVNGARAENEARNADNNYYKWISVDPRTGSIVEYDEITTGKLNRAFSARVDLVTLEEFSATVYFGKDGHHLQKTMNGERDVRRVQVGDTITVRAIGTSGFRITDSGTQVRVE